jgi:hypothetical protein
MAQFRATIEGQRGQASRLGSKTSGMVAKVNGWDSGVMVYAEHVDGKDRFEVMATKGSNSGERKLLGYVDDNGFHPIKEKHP